MGIAIPVSTEHWGSTGWVFLFTDTFLYSEDPTYIPPSPPQLENPEGNVLFDTTEWVPMSWIYTAEGNEKVMTVGNFYETSQITHPPMEEPGHYRSFFFFDNFCVRNINDPVDSFGNNRTVGICNYDTGFHLTTGTMAGMEYGRYCRIPGPMIKSPFGGQDTAKMTVKSIFNCKIHMDTIVVYKKPIGISYNIDTTLCTNDTALLNLGKIYPNLVFFDSVHRKMRNPPTLDNQTAGKYRFYFKLADSCTDNFGTVNVTVVQTPEINLEDLTLKCIGDSAFISVQDSAGSLLWEHRSHHAKHRRKRKRELHGHDDQCVWQHIRSYTRPV
ncbi:MAG: hypothetical protein KL787_01610 [Taibaiella sp.]|nr:hypothetical protein [Taibaiella sp.]